MSTRVAMTAALLLVARSAWAGEPAAPVIVSPANGSTTYDTTPVIYGTAGTGDTVTVALGSFMDTVSVDGNGDWAMVIPSSQPLTPGQYTVTAVANLDGGMSTAAASMFTVVAGSSVPAPVITSPTSGEVLGAAVAPDGMVSFNGVAEPGSVVVLSVTPSAALPDGGMPSTTANAAGNWALTVALSNGSYTTTATASLNSSTSMPSAQLTFTVNTTPPTTPTLTAGTQPLGTSTPTFKGTADVSDTIAVDVDSQPSCSTTAEGEGTWSCVAETSLADGTHMVTVTATDAAGNTSTSQPVSITIAATPPGAPVIMSPLPGAVVSSMPTIQGTDTGGSSVTVTVDGTVAGTASVQSGSWSVSVTTALSSGAHSAEAIAVNAAGVLSGASVSVAFIVGEATALAPPQINSLGTLLVGETPTFSGLAVVDSDVQVSVDMEASCSTTANGAGQWSCTASAPLTAGTHTITVASSDPTTGATSATTITVDVAAPAAKTAVEYVGGACSTTGATAWMLAAAALFFRRRRAR